MKVTILSTKLIKNWNTSRITLFIFLLNICSHIQNSHQNDIIETQENLHNKSVGVNNLESPQDIFLRRRKRFVWMKNRKLILPPGSILTVSPKLQIPFLRQPPEGLNSDISLTWIFYMFFDKLGMTDEAHPWPPFYPFSDLFRIIRRQPVVQSIKRRLFGRSVLSLPPPERIHGGERATIIPQLERMLTSIGIDHSRACLLRTVCEIHEFPLHEQGFGLFGELLTLIFTVSLSPYAESHLVEYVKAEKAGKSGDCWEYFKKCKKSLFVWKEKNKYRKEMQNTTHSADEFDSQNEIFDSSIM